MSVWFLAQVAAAQTIQNPSFNAMTPMSVPNTLAMPGWTLIEGADVAQGGVSIDCADILTPSPDGGQFLRATAGETVSQGASTMVNNLTLGTPYMVQFDAALVRHLGQATGHWTVSFAFIELAAPEIVLPAGNPEQTAWRSQEVGPFVALEPNLVLEFRANADTAGVDLSPDLPNKVDGCNYGSELTTADLLLDGIVIVPDTDLDGLFDDEEAELGTDPTSADTDLDTLLDYEEVYTYGTDPVDDDSDDDLLIDGLEVALKTGPLDPDADNDGLLDGEEVLTYGTDPLDPDTDGDGYADNDEITLGTDPVDPDSFPMVTVPTEPEPTDTGTEPTPGTGTGTGTGKDDDGGCQCSTNGGIGGGWLGGSLVALALAGVRRRRTPLARMW